MNTRNTIQRDLVLTAVHTLYHPTADEVFSHVTDQYPNISKGTVYRNLNVLVEQGTLRKVSLSGTADRFDITLEDHYHVQCKLCGKVDDVDLPYQTGLLASVRDAHGFLIEGHELTLKGICPQCRVQSGV